MKDFNRTNLLFSLCGLNCGLCPMHLDKYCPGCGGGAGNQSCAIAKCSLLHGEVEYCSYCNDFPCERYDSINEFDSFITYQNREKDFMKANGIGIDAYNAEQTEKIEILKFMLANYNDGRRKTFFCVAINLLELQDIKSIMKQITDNTELNNLSLKEKAAYVVQLFQNVATQQDILLKLRKRPSKKK